MNNLPSETPAYAVSTINGISQLVKKKDIRRISRQITKFRERKRQLITNSLYA